MNFEYVCIHMYRSSECIIVSFEIVVLGYFKR